MPDDDPPSDHAPQGLAETPAITPGTLYDERHFIGGMAIDITEQHAEENLRDSGESVRRLIDAIPQIVWTNNVDGTARDFNRRWYQYTGLNYEQSAGPGWQAVIHPDDAPVSKERWQEALETGEVFECEYRLRNAAGEYRWFIGRNVPVRDNNRIIGWVGSATDVHDLKMPSRGGGKRRALSIDGRWRARLRHLLREPEQRDRLLERGRGARIRLERCRSCWGIGRDCVHAGRSRKQAGGKGNRDGAARRLRKRSALAHSQERHANLDGRHDAAA
jgi:PAS domain S-box-containing protein